MLHGVHPLVPPRLLAALAEMGHGDTVAVTDAHFPATRVARANGATVVEVPGCDAPTIIAAIRTLLPLDPDGPAVLMSDAGGGSPAVHADLHAALGATPGGVVAVGRLDFYQEAARSWVIVRTGETRPYGNAVLPKGLVQDGAR